MAFGESSLDFELRIWIHRIEKRFDVVSGVNFAIDKAFRAHGIQIPFPQRDLHVRSWEPTAAPVIPGKAAKPD
jgi:small-conductance mechanosensitive channel